MCCMATRSSGAFAFEWTSDHRLGFVLLHARNSELKQQIGAGIECKSLSPGRLLPDFRASDVHLLHCPANRKCSQRTINCNGCTQLSDIA